MCITPTANRNSYRVARLVGAITQGSVLRPQPWAGETQLLQSCCCLRAAVYMYPLHCCYLRAAVCMYPLHCCCLRAAVYMYPLHCCYLRAAVCMYPLHCCCLRAAVYMYSFRCCCLRAAVYMYSFRCCYLRAAVCMYPLHCCCLRVLNYPPCHYQYIGRGSSPLPWDSLLRRRYWRVAFSDYFVLWLISASSGVTSLWQKPAYLQPRRLRLRFPRQSWSR